MKLLFFIPVLFCNCLVAMAQDSLPLKISLPNNVNVDSFHNKCVVIVKSDSTIHFKGNIIKKENLLNTLEKYKCDIVVLNIARDLPIGVLADMLSTLEKGKFKTILGTANE